MDLKPQKPPFLFASPLAVWTELAFKLWGFGKPPERSAPEKQVSVAVIPTSDAQPAQPAKAARAHSSPKKRTKAKARSKTKSKRARR